MIHHVDILRRQSYSWSACVASERRSHACGILSTPLQQRRRGARGEKKASGRGRHPSSLKHKSRERSAAAPLLRRWRRGRNRRLALGKLDQRDFVQARHTLQLQLLGEVARNPMLAANVAQRRSFDLADILSVPTAWVEVAPRRRVCRTGHITRKFDRSCPLAWIGFRNGSQQRFGIRMFGVVVLCQA